MNPPRLCRKQNAREVTQPIRKQSERDAITDYFWRRKDFRDYALFLLGIHTGRRIVDLLALNVRDVAYIDRKGRLRVVERLKLQEQKTGKFVDMLLHRTARRALGKYLARRRGEAPSLEALLASPLFQSQKARIGGERRITKRHALRVLTVAARACGLNYKIGTHSMRKTFGYQLHQDGTDIALIQRLLNHSSPEVTLSYIGITRDDMDAAIRGFGGVAKEKKTRKPRKSRGTGAADLCPDYPGWSL